MPRSLRCLFLSLVFAGFAVTVMAAETPKPDKPDKPVPTVPTTTAPDNADIKEAQEFFRKGTSADIDKARAALEKARVNDQDLPPPSIFLFQWYAQTNRPGPAKAELDKARNDAEVFVILGNLALQDARVTDADLDFEKAAALMDAVRSTKRKNILMPQIINGRATVAEFRKEWEVAQKYLEQLVTVNRKIKASEPAPAKGEKPVDTSRRDAEVLRRLAHALFMQATGDSVKQSYAVLKQAYEINKAELPVAEAILALFYEENKNYETARKWMGYAEGQGKNDLRTRLVMTNWALRNSGRDPKMLDEAERHAKAALDAKPDSVDAMNLRGTVALFKKEYPEAEKHFQQAYLASPGSFPAHNNLVLALCEQSGPDNKRKRTQAVELARTLVSSYPKNPEALSTAGRAFFCDEKTDQALQAFQMLAQSGALNTESAYYFAECLLKKGGVPEKKLARQLLQSVKTGEEQIFPLKDVAMKKLADLDKELGPDDEKTPAKKETAKEPAGKS